MMNPLKAARQDLGLTQDQLGKEANGIARLTVLRAEQGVYQLPPPAILNALQRRGLNPEKLEREYLLWQTRERQLHRHALSLPLPTPADFAAVADFSDAEFSAYAQSQPLVQWRIISGIESQIEFCKMFCVHPAVISNFEAGRQRKIPTQLVDALTDAGIDYQVITELAKRCREFYDKHNGVVPAAI